MLLCYNHQAQENLTTKSKSFEVFLNVLNFIVIGQWSEHKRPARILLNQRRGLVLKTSYYTTSK